ncbi:peptide-methionine (S)-S-oxide reductase MsrA [uncultured Dokdonia sp.]|jgi:peptide-methionine (S)-S-oxide reductase|uniref:peptide-methionine (S)-S-oxide reductase MsrA n=1 Tax=unclassified Dokdonia TaxID=2615033 RepID=UPI0026022A51|nr:peptide-methionine (S)-S-oxide reductase MsrA [uncultured Dokdonia sp.]|tara:strand:+ start:47027 stop:47566 length:540 start_codon:yes stop_codon:yes gene_type:complete
MKNNLQQATIGGGCFWCVEAVIQRLKGVSNVVSGYAGGQVPGHPTYREICSGLTGHAEVIQFDFDPAVITYAEILTVFLTTHDPTTLNQQGADRGTQYRSVIFYHNDEQKAQAEQVIKVVQEYYEDPIVTEVSGLPTFYDATQEHQDYYNENRQQGYCRVVIDPKVAKLKKFYEHLLAS